jgi:hypothetical protein
MLPAIVDISAWSSWAALGSGAAVAALVAGGGLMVGRWRGRPRMHMKLSTDEELPWDLILHLVEEHNHARAEKGEPPEELTDDLLAQLVARLPVIPDRPESKEDREYRLGGGAEKRTSRRRWGNPTDILLRTYLWEGDTHGLVVNRSTGGLGIYIDREVPADTSLQVRAVEAPHYIPSIWAEVRHCRKVGKGWFLGCQFSDEVPWNVRVWFG